MTVRARIVGVGTAVPPTSYSQQEVLDTFEITDARARGVFLNSAIERRHLVLPRPAPTAAPSASSRAICSTSTKPTPWSPGSAPSKPA